MKNLILLFPVLLCAQTAQYPSAVATDASLKVTKNGIATSLRASARTGDTVMQVADCARIEANMLLTIARREIVSVTSVGANCALTVVRGFDGTAAVAHAGGAEVASFPTAWERNSLKAEIVAIQTALGADLSNVTDGQQPDTSTFNFSQTPGGSLTPGANSVTLSPVPRGVNGSDTNHTLWVSGGTGTAEACAIIGGSAVAGAASGTVIITCANSHSGAWTIASSTAGIKEAAVEAAPGSKMITLPRGTTVQTHAPIILTGNVNVIGNGATIQADLSVSPVLQLGTATLLADRIQLLDLTVSRAAGSIPAGSIGVLWQWYSYGRQERVRITRHARGEKFANYTSPGVGSLGLASVDSWVDIATEAYLVFDNAIAVYWVGGGLGVNAGIVGDAPTYGMIVSGQSDTLMFSEAEMIPRGSPIPASLMSFQNFTGTNGVFYFDHCNLERWDGLVTSDASSPLIHELTISDSRLALGAVDWFNLNAATTLSNFTLTGSSTAGNLNLTNPAWARISGNFITGSGATIAGGAGANMAFSGNIVAATYTFSGTWQNLSITGNSWWNTFPSITATGAVNGSLQVVGNTSNTGAHIANKLGDTTFSGAATLLGAGHAALAAYTPANGSIVHCLDCQSSTTITPGSTCVSGGVGALAVRLNGAWRCY